MSDARTNVTKAVVTRLGWDEHEKFSARIEFPDGPPDWPISIGWGDRPVYICLVPPEPVEMEPT